MSEDPWEDLKRQFTKIGNRLAETFKTPETQKDYVLMKPNQDKKPAKVKKPRCAYCHFKLHDPLDTVYVDEHDPKNVILYHQNCWTAVNEAAREAESLEELDVEEVVDVNDAMRSGAEYDEHNWFRIPQVDSMQEWLDRLKGRTYEYKVDDGDFGPVPRPQPVRDLDYAQEQKMMNLQNEATLKDRKLTRQRRALRQLNRSYDVLALQVSHQRLMVTEMTDRVNNQTETIDRYKGTVKALRAQLVTAEHVAGQRLDLVEELQTQLAGVENDRNRLEQKYKGLDEMFREAGEEIARLDTQLTIAEHRPTAWQRFKAWATAGV